MLFDEKKTYRIRELTNKLNRHMSGGDDLQHAPKSIAYYSKIARTQVGGHPIITFDCFADFVCVADYKRLGILAIFFFQENILRKFDFLIPFLFIGFAVAYNK